MNLNSVWTWLSKKSNGYHMPMQKVYHILCLISTETVVRKLVYYHYYYQYLYSFPHCTILTQFCTIILRWMQFCSNARKIMMISTSKGSCWPHPATKKCALRNQSQTSEQTAPENGRLYNPLVSNTMPINNNNILINCS